jgi:beta-glucanase (GH16 family)
VWHDEFNGPNGAAPDKGKWVVQTGGNGWGNSELEYYTARGENVRQENGSLVIEAIQGKYVGPDGVARKYTSGRLNTSGRFSQTYGRFEARIKNPAGRGVWPAFWMMGNDLPTVGWPACGEIDVMEEIGPLGSQIRGSLHGPGYSGRNALTSSYRLPAGDFGDAFHVFALEWEPEVLRFYVDGQLYATRTPSDLRAGTRWVYDHPFFLILNLAVRGDGPDGLASSTAFPQRMLVDYVRVYKRK